MVAAAWGGAEGADLIALVVDGKGGLGAKVDRRSPRRSPERPEPKYLILNKVDRRRQGQAAAPCRAAERAAAVRRDLLRQRRDRRRPARTEDARSPRAMPAGPWHYPEDQVSDATERALAAEVTREQLYLQLHAELPYASAVETETLRGARRRLGRDPPADPGRTPDAARDRAGQGRRADQRDRRARARRTGEHDGPAGPPVPARQGQARLGRGPRASTATSGSTGWSEPSPRAQPADCGTRDGPISITATFPRVRTLSTRR